MNLLSTRPTRVLAGLIALALGLTALGDLRADGLPPATGRTSTDNLRPASPGDPVPRPTDNLRLPPPAGPAARPTLSNLRQTSLELSNIVPGELSRRLIVGAGFTIKAGQGKDFVVVATVYDLKGQVAKKANGAPLEARSALRPLISDQITGYRFQFPLADVEEALGKGARQFRVFANVYDSAGKAWMASPSLAVTVDLDRLERTFGAPKLAPRPVPPKAAPAGARPTVGTWSIISGNGLKTMFDLNITSVNGATIWYTTTLNHRPQSGRYIPSTGYLNFNYTDRGNVERNFSGTIKQDTTGKWVIEGSSTIPGNSIRSYEFFRGQRVR